MDNLTYRTEKPLFIILFLLSTLFWLAITLGTLGIVLIYLLLGFLIYLFAQSAFISYIRGTGVKVSKTQFPELYAMHQGCCAKLSITEEPELFIINADGMLNALATKFLGTKYVVLYSNIVDALESNPDAVRFYIGHELGHIKQKHLTWGPYLFPASILPIIGAAYSRAREYTCDLHGYKCCETTPENAFHAIAVLAAGEKKWQSLNIPQYMQQTAWTGGFWMSLHELTGDYPWLSKRIAHIYSIANRSEPRMPARHFLAWIFALFIPRTGMRGGGLFSLMIVIAIIGILAAIALPAYQDYMIRAKASEAVITGNKISAAIGQHIAQHRDLPESLEAAGYISENETSSSIDAIEYDDYRGSFTIYLKSNNATEQTIVFKPYMDDGNLNWDCTEGTLLTKHRPTQCR